MYAKVGGLQVICEAILQLVATCGGSFAVLEPPLQAVVQAAAKVVMHSPVAAADVPAVLALIKAIPLLHGKDYIHIMSQSTAGGLSGRPDRCLSHHVMPAAGRTGQCYIRCLTSCSTARYCQVL